MSTTHLKQRRLATWIAGRSKQFWIVAALAVAIAYPLSFGPFLWFCDRGLVYGPIQAVLRPIYAPLSIACLVPPVERTMSWYTGLWFEDASDEIPGSAVFQTDTMPDGRIGLSIVYP